MGTIIPVPTTRISDQLGRQRLLAQLQSDQLELFRLQTQLSSGRRIILPSDDAPSALRAVGLQQLLERKTTVQTNLTTNASYLRATDTSLGGVSDLLAEIRGIALSVSDSTASDLQRQAAVSDVNRAIAQLIDLGNQRFRDRYLFAGTQTADRPFAMRGEHVEYRGNEGTLLSYADLDVLFATNITGHDVFGTFSSSVQGTADLNPVVSADTPLADLFDGEGVPLGSVQISNGTTTSTIDLSGAKTLGDIARLLEAHPPAGSVVRADLTTNGLRVALDSGDLRLVDVGGGTTATHLGIARAGGSGPGPVVSTDLAPRVTKTTRLDDLLGVRATASITSTGTNNNLVFQASQRGPEFNDVTILYVDGGPGAAGAETAVYDDSDPSNKTLTITIASGTTTANRVIEVVNAEGTFRASLDRHEGANSGEGVVTATTLDPGATATTSGGSGVEFDQASGLRIVNGGVTYNISFAGAVTVEDLLNQLNGSQAGVLAEIAADGKSISIRSRLSGADFSVGENGGATASQLGVRTLTGATRLKDLNYGIGVIPLGPDGAPVPDALGADFVIRRKDGVELEIDVNGATTIQDVLDLINLHADNQDPATRVTARLAAYGNGIELVTTDATPGASITVTSTNLSQAAVQLGLIPAGATSASSNGTDQLTGRDVNPQQVDGAFTALIRLRQALEVNDTRAIARSIEMLDNASTAFSFARAELGVRQQSLDLMQARLENEVIELKSTLSDEIDADLAAVLSELVTRQAAMQASLQSIAQTFRLSLLDFL
ncbi:MAG: hypothetical protein KF708_22265 [Pirellulales bacterium]|nr:hypothetical protein [Pirellulales bacterium]